MKRIQIRKKIKIIVYAVVACGGIVAIIVDYTQNFLPSELQTLLAFITTLSAFMSLLNVELEEFYHKETKKYSKQQLKQVLELYGINTVMQQDECDSTKQPCNDAICDLIYLVAQSMHKRNGNLLNGNVDLSTDFYIYTKATAHVDQYLSIMTRYMRALIEEIQNRIQIQAEANNEYPLYYLIVPYGTNILLGDQLSKELGIPLLISQGKNNEKHKGANITIENDTYEFLYQNFLGMDALKQAIQSNIVNGDIEEKAITLNGIIVDDNVTSGETPFSIARLFNNRIFPFIESVEDEIKAQILSENVLDDETCIRFKRIEYSAFLFMAHNNAKDKLFEKLDQLGIKMLCFFILNEGIKSTIYEKRQLINSSNKISAVNREMVIHDIAPMCKFKIIKDVGKQTVKEMIYTLPEEREVFSNR